MRVNMDNTGSFVIRKSVREPLSREQGVWTLRTGEAISPVMTDRLLQQIRRERDAANLNAGCTTFLDPEDLDTD